MRRVFVTGATGFLGQALCRALRDRGDFVVGLVRDRTAEWAPDVDVAARGDLERPSIERILAEYGIDTAIHLAAQSAVKTAFSDPTGTLDANVRGTWNVLEACRRQGVGRVVVASSDKAYGDALAPYTEEQPVSAHGVYATSKACADLIAQTYLLEYGMSIAVTRCTNLYGPGPVSPSTLIPSAIRAALTGERPVIRGDGTMRRDYLYIDDAAAAYLALVDSPHTGAFNFGTGVASPIVDVVRAVMRLCGADLSPRFEPTAAKEIPDQWTLGRRARVDLRWAPAVTLETGLKRTIAWHRARLDGVAK